ncbi:hypothetical protein DC522_31495 [Microvirga sp. KLBC 81]|uniref:hypothetical protein n=1 Tax=Microvirga sp. KLBC 81 TaxID=1862707 RepID=UPI000D510366|nr:hypothetical protein [Microvirga sp. KLBC 81]PVE20581.1 hypothetical protein DC522_31495 [Microvirga sp. KLBC 81]
MQYISTTTLFQSKDNSRPLDTGYKPRIHTISEEFGAPGSALARARNAGIIDNREYQAGQRMAALWQAAGRLEQQARLSAGRSLLALGENVAYAVVSVCRDNCGVGNPHRASLLKQGLSKLASHFAQTGGFANV